MSMEPHPTSESWAAGQVVVVEPQRAMSGLLRERLGAVGLGVLCVTTAEELDDHLHGAAKVDLIVLSCDSPAEHCELLRHLAGSCAAVPVLSILRPECFQSVGEVFSNGASAVLLRYPGYLDQLGVVAAGLVRQGKGAALQGALQDIREENHRLHALIERLEAAAATDPLTGLLNRRAVDSQGATLFASATRYGAELSCLMIDLDHLKLVNDRLGHASGDELIKAAAAAIAQEIRSSDVAGRIGGDEFVVLMPHTPAGAAMHLARRIQKRFKLTCKPVAGRLREQGRLLGVSIGVASSAMAAVKARADMLNLADEAMYAAKRSGAGLAMSGGHGQTALQTA